MLAHQHYAIDGQFAAAERQRLGDRRIHLRFGMPRDALLAQVVLTHLIDVQRDQVH